MRNKRESTMPRPITVMVCVLAVVLIISVCIVAVSALQKPSIGYAEGGGPDPYARTGEGAFENTVVLNGQTYRRNTRLKTVLFLGIDRVQSDLDKLFFGRGGFSDAIFLMILDPDTETTRLLSFSRNAMVNVDVYNQDDKYIETSLMQLTCQYSYSSSPRRGCWLTKNKISELLYGMPIDCCLSMTMDGIAVVVDALGGLDLTMTEDHTEINPAYIEGATVHLDGAAANHYIRYRDTQHSGGADQRTERQLQLIKTLAKQVNGSTIDATLEAAQPFIESDIDADTLQQLSTYTLQSEFYRLPGHAQLGEVYDEFIIDEQALKELVIELFYVPEEQAAG